VDRGEEGGKAIPSWEQLFLIFARTKIRGILRKALTLNEPGAVLGLNGRGKELRTSVRGWNTKGPGRGGGEEVGGWGGKKCLDEGLAEDGDPNATQTRVKRKGFHLGGGTGAACRTGEKCETFLA